MNYEIRKIKLNNDQLLQQLVNLQNVVYKGRHVFTVDGFKKWYVDNPMGEVISFNAFFGDEMVAHYACIPYKMMIKGVEALGLLDMATVTHPDHRGKGLFKKLAQATYEYAKDHGFQFVLGVANGNSYPGYMKYFPFKDYGKLEVKVGIGNNIYEHCNNRSVFVFWTPDVLKWRIRIRKKGDYNKSKKILWGKMKIPFFKLVMGEFDDCLLPKDLPQSKKRIWFNPFNLYIGLGANTKKGLYINVPKWIKHSPFHLLYLDLTDGILPSFEREDIFFQLIDFDVA